MKRLLIIGAGGFGREVFTWARDNPAHLSEWNVAGFLDSRKDALDKFVKDPRELRDAMPHPDNLQAWHKRDVGIVGDPMTYVPGPDDLFLCAQGDPVERRRYATPIIEKGGKFITLIHPRSQVGTYVTLAEGTIVGPFVSVSPDVTIGRFVTINSYTSLAHDVTVGDWCEIDGHCLIAGRASIGESVRIHGGAIITPGISVGDGATVGAGSVVFGRVPPNTTVIGNPARRFDWRAEPQGAKEP